MKEIFYYFRDNYNHPRITVCVIQDDEGNVGKGIALCSLSESPDKKVGRLMAKSNALLAHLNKKDDLLIWRDEAYDVMASTWNGRYDAVRYKSYYNPHLNTKELDLLTNTSNICQVLKFETMFTLNEIELANYMDMKGDVYNTNITTGIQWLIDTVNVLVNGVREHCNEIHTIKKQKRKQNVDM